MRRPTLIGTSQWLFEERQKRGPASPAYHGVPVAASTGIRASGMALQGSNRNVRAESTSTSMFVVSQAAGVIWCWGSAQVSE